MQSTYRGVHKFTKCDEEGVPLFVQDIVFRKGYFGCDSSNLTDAFIVKYFDGQILTIFTHTLCIPSGTPDKLKKDYLKQLSMEAAEKLWEPVPPTTEA